MPEHSAQKLHYPEDSDIQEGAIRVSTPKPRPKPSEDYTREGIYIPASGGIRGWFENSGVPVVEHPNNYRFHEAVDADAFRQSSINRLHEYNKRNAKRFEAALPVTLRDSKDGSESPSFCVDVSITGTKLRTRVELLPDSPVHLTFCSPRKRNAPEETLFVVDGIVRWCTVATVVRETVRYFMGVEFLPLDLVNKEALAKLLR
ncbi:MAG: PilZ domain-containing protein [Candidatus Lambdaproteobacteria bacterium]|nr:PilZ domain-containing protein [Candidatus Lambdaproteobacteria bacterium]